MSTDDRGAILQYSDELRSSLWNVLHQEIWDQDGFLYTRYGSPVIFSFAREFWMSYVKKPFTHIPNSSQQVLGEIQSIFFGAAWNVVYDILEAVLDIITRESLQSSLNRILEREHAAYRLSERRFIQVTDYAELEAFGDAVAMSGKYSLVAKHMQRALEVYSDRKNPDYRNAIKEAISVVESMACVVAGWPKATLGDALTELERSGRLHRALKSGFSALYGYTSDADGIRHGMMDESNVSEADAKFFLLACASFINYLKASTAT